MRRTLSASSLAGTDVRSPEGSDLGRIEDLMIDLATGEVAYAVLSFGGLLGIGNKLFAVPWDVLIVDPESERLVLDVPRERLESAPGFDKNDWPDFSDPVFEDALRTHYAPTTRPPLPPD